MPSFQRMLCLAKFELYRLFLTKRGALALVAFATAWFLILRYLVSSAATIVSSKMFQDMAEQVFGMLGLSELLTWEVPELAIYWLVAVYSFPVFSLFAASDQTCADRTRGTLRFISLRASRVEIVCGRFAGQLAIMAILIALTLVATSLMAAYNNSEILIVAITQSLYLFTALFIVILPFVGLMTFINSFVRSSRLALVLSLLFFGLGPLIIALLEYKLAGAASLNYIFPGIQISDIVDPQNTATINHFIPIIQAAAYLLLANIIMKRSAL